MIRTSCAIFALFVTLTAARAETAEERGKRIVDEAIAALGGPAFLGVNNIVETGRMYSFYREKLQGLAVATLYTEYRRPAGADKLAVSQRQSFGKNNKEIYSVLFTPSEAWDITFRGARPLASDRFPRYKLSTMHDIFYILRERLHEPGMIFVSKGSDVLDNRPVE